ncbi:MAG: L,D-transpeptidase family protein [Parasphingorhabdus sp.]|nr:L,D-transpeptidase family protein [Parasphingorhabdus sp.]
MKRTSLLIVIGLSILWADTALAADVGWSTQQMARLRIWIAAAPIDALPQISTAKLDSAIAQRDPVMINVAADGVALALASCHLLGCADAPARSGWGIIDSDREIDLPTYLAAAVRDDRIDQFFASLRPRHPEYLELRGAYNSAVDPARRAILARNMERWRWLPIDLGEQHLVVNVPAFQLTYWVNGKALASWPVIVGKTKTPTPVFSAVVTGVTFNPWWEIPQSIVAESVGRLVRRNPAEARRRGYVWSNGRYRQKPGAKNALGLMKLVMPNHQGIYLHDTPAKALFKENQRAFSHGCVRVGDALGFAATLLTGKMTREAVDALIAKGEPATVTTRSSIPLFVTYFTAGIGADGSVTTYRDIYRHDQRLSTASAGQSECAA